MEQDNWEMDSLKMKQMSFTKEVMKERKNRQTFREKKTWSSCFATCQTPLSIAFSDEHNNSLQYHSLLTFSQKKKKTFHHNTFSVEFNETNN